MEPPSDDTPAAEDAVVCDDAEAEDYSHQVDEVSIKVEKIEQKLMEVENFYLNLCKKQQQNISKCNSGSKDKKSSSSRTVLSVKKQQQDAACREAVAAKRMQDLIRQISIILRQISQHKWARPFLQPVDVEGLGLDDYYKVIDKPMDFSTIKNQIEAKDGNGYKSVRDVCADIRLVFKNAMKYNDDRSDVHVMAKTLLEKFEEKWLQLLPKVVEEEKRRDEEEAEAQLEMQLAQEIVHAKIAKDISNELYEVDMHLQELRELVIQKCRKISNEEKRKLGSALAKLTPENLSKALEIVAQSNPDFAATAEEIDIDIDALSETTLWRLKIFTKDALELQDKRTAPITEANNPSNIPTSNNKNNKRKKAICDALAKTAKKITKTKNSRRDDVKFNKAATDSLTMTKSNPNSSHLVVIIVLD